MIIICVAVRSVPLLTLYFSSHLLAQTDVLPALSLCMEPPEHGLLLRKPRNIKKDRLADWKLILHAYGFLGMIESLCAMSMLVISIATLNNIV